MRIDNPMTIRELADALGVSKTTVRNHMDLCPDFREKYTETRPGNTGNILMISAEGCEKLLESIGNDRKEVKSQSEKFSETAENTITIPISVLETLQEQLRIKDQQIETLNATLSATADSLRAAQALHAGTIQAQLEEGKTIESQPHPKQPWWKIWK